MHVLHYTVCVNVCDNDYHDSATNCLPVLARPLQGLNVTPLFTLMIGVAPDNHVCCRKPTSVTYNHDSV